MTNDFKAQFLNAPQNTPFVDASALFANGDTTQLIIDVRDPRERARDGCIKGAYPMPRGMVEFWMHKDSPYYRTIFERYKKFVFVCAKGWRAQLAAQTASHMGYESYILKGGMSAWNSAHLPMVGNDGEPYYGLSDIESMLPHILQRKNIARLEDGAVLIGNRAQFPFEKSFVRCETIEDIARAIETMVTQGVGPWIAAVHGLILKARQMKTQNATAVLSALNKAKDRLIATRPTNTMIALRLNHVLKCARAALDNGLDPAEAMEKEINTLLDDMYKIYHLRARHGARLVNDGDGILTMCFAETSFVLAMILAKKSGKNFTVYVPETRPYLQGARLTAPALHEVGVQVKLITDGMPAALMSAGKIDKYMTAADLITLDGHVVNKVGTFQNAIAAHHHKIPYFAFAWGFDESKPDRESIEIEWRNAEEIRKCRTVATTIDEIDGLYPAFDITPPHLVAGVITREGIKSPCDLKGCVG